MRPSRLTRAVLAQAGAETRLTLRRGESLLVTVIIPAALFIFFASSRILPSSGRSVAFLLPGTLALAVISTALVSLGIATAYERYYGVLKVLGATPFPRVGLIAAKLLAVLEIEAGQVVLLGSIAAIFYGWRPHGSVLLAIAVLLLGTAAFVGIGMAMAGGLRAEATLAGANGLFLFFLLLGGLYVPLSSLPAPLAAFARVLPADALGEALRGALNTGSLPGRALAVLIIWAVLAPALAAAVFRWE